MLTDEVLCDVVRVDAGGTSLLTLEEEARGTYVLADEAFALIRVIVCIFNRALFVDLHFSLLPVQIKEDRSIIRKHKILIKIAIVIEGSGSWFCFHK